ncbi:MAG: undecaprenyl-diphosphate phosphatase [Phycisphaerales bacterium]|nr:undecaprenyl-diphosphate phosphatase [Phycisphaerales bacterium]
MEAWHAVILGLVEGITEFLPVSSTGHLVLASALLGLDGPGMKPAVDAFEIVIQGGAILAVAGLYWPRIVQMLRGLLGRDPAGLRLAVALLIAFIPSALLGLLLGDWIKARLFFAGPVMIALAAGAVYMWLVEKWSEKARQRETGAAAPDAGHGTRDPLTVTPMQAFLVGVLQCFALLPGTSRAMMTITGGYFIGLPPGRAAEFSFLLGLPTLGAATLYSLYKDLKESHAAGRPNLFEVLGVGPAVIGIVVAAVSAAFAVRWLVGFLGRRGLAPFAWYRLALAGGLFFAWWLGAVAMPLWAQQSVP